MVDAGLPPPGTAETLAGRRGELELIRSFLDRAAVSGAALLLSGEPGVGKTVLLDAAERAASAAGCRVLRAAGVEFEGDVSFAGLNQLLFPLHGDLGQLGAAHREALSVALGFGRGPPPGPPGRVQRRAHVPASGSRHATGAGDRR